MCGTIDLSELMTPCGWKRKREACPLPLPSFELLTPLQRVTVQCSPEQHCTPEQVFLARVKNTQSDKSHHSDPQQPKKTNNVRKL